MKDRARVALGGQSSPFRGRRGAPYSLLGAVALAALVASFALPGAAATPRLPRLTVCGDAFSIRPDYVLLGCGDGGQFLADVRWSSWTAAAARGSGVWWQNLCTPDCASGHFRRVEVAIRLWRPRTCRAPRVRLFTRLELASGSGRPTRVKVPTIGRARCP